MIDHKDGHVITDSVPKIGCFSEIHSTVRIIMITNHSAY